MTFLHWPKHSSTENNLLFALLTHFILFLLKSITVLKLEINNKTATALPAKYKGKDQESCNCYISVMTRDVFRGRMSAAWKIMLKSFFSSFFFFFIHCSGSDILMIQRPLQEH